MQHTASTTRAAINGERLLTISRGELRAMVGEELAKATSQDRPARVLDLVMAGWIMVATLFTFFQSIDLWRVLGG